MHTACLRLFIRQIAHNLLDSMAGKTIQTCLVQNDKIENLKASYLAAHQGLEFSSARQLDAKHADAERRRSFLSIKARAAGLSLKNDLEDYASVVDNRNGLNNYWKQFSLLNVATNNNPSEWKSHLSDPNLALQHAQPLSCNEISTLACKNEQLFERDVEKVMGWWERGEVSPRARKISTQEKRPTGQLAGAVVSAKDSHQPARVSSPTDTGSRFKSTNRADFNSGKTVAGKVNARSEQNRSNRSEGRGDIEKLGDFKTARTALSVQQQASKNSKQAVNNTWQPPMKKSLGGKALNSPFVCPLRDNQPKEEEAAEPTDERLKSIEPKMVELIRNEIMDCGNPIAWDDIAGLESAKRIIQEIVVYPMLRPDIFTGLRRPPKGILLFGPPGTGKTLIGKCIASQSRSTFFSISASSLTSKWVGEGEKMVRALFAVAQVEQPSVVFIDEIDSLLCQRSETEHESSRRMKTEFLVQLDGASTGDEDRILVVGATNRPHELDEAARRRFVKRLYVPLPELEARKQIVRNLLKSERHDLTDDDIDRIAELSDGYSGADMTNLCKEASMGPIRSIPFERLEEISREDVGQVGIRDFKDALEAVRPSVSQKDLSVYMDWNSTYGTASAQARNS